MHTQHYDYWRRLASAHRTRSWHLNCGTPGKGQHDHKQVALASARRFLVDRTAKHARRDCNALVCWWWFFLPLSLIASARSVAKRLLSGPRRQALPTKLDCPGPGSRNSAGVADALASSDGTDNGMRHAMMLYISTTRLGCSSRYLSKCRRWCITRITAHGIAAVRSCYFRETAKPDQRATEPGTGEARGERKKNETG